MDYPIKTPLYNMSIDPEQPPGVSFGGATLSIFCHGSKA